LFDVLPRILNVVFRRLGHSNIDDREAREKDRQPDTFENHTSYVALQGPLVSMFAPPAWAVRALGDIHSRSKSRDAGAHYSPML
jgi:hypothetical protein